MTSKADLQAAVNLLQGLVAAQPDDPVVVLPPPPPPPSPFDDRSYYPPQPVLNVLDCAFDPNAKEVHVRVELDRPNPTTVYVKVGPSNGNLLYSGFYFEKVNVPICFRPGDPLVQTIRVPILRPCPVGGTFKVEFNDAPRGASKGKSGIATSVAGAAQTVPVTEGFRAPRTFNPTGTLQFELDVPNMKWRDGGSATEWNTRLAHGRIQGAGQTSVYVDADLFPGIEAPHRIEGNAVVLHSQKFAAPVPYNKVGWYYGGAVLTGDMMPATQILFGQYEWEMQTTSRKYSWPALWLLPVGGGWPPEIDVYEGFGQSSTFNLNTTTSCAIHGGPDDIHTWMRNANVLSSEGRFEPSLNAQFHKYQVDIQPDYITMFVGGLETFQFVNPFLKSKWYPLMNVGVKTPNLTTAYDTDSGDMRVSLFRVWNNG